MANPLTPSLWQLPAELRNEIYRYVFGGNIFELYKSDGCTALRLSSRGSLYTHTALLRTSRQIHNEASLLLYSMNSFCFGRTDFFLDWFVRRTVLQLTAITTLRLRCWRGLHLFVGSQECHDLGLAVMARMTGLERFEIVVTAFLDDEDATIWTRLRTMAGLIRVHHPGADIVPCEDHCFRPRIAFKAYLGTL